MANTFQNFAQQNLAYLEQVCRVIDNTKTRIECENNQRLVITTLKVIYRGMKRIRKQILTPYPNEECIGLGQEIGHLPGVDAGLPGGAGGEKVAAALAELALKQSDKTQRLGR